MNVFLLLFLLFLLLQFFTERKHDIHIAIHSKMHIWRFFVIAFYIVECLRLSFSLNCFCSPSIHGNVDFSWNLNSKPFSSPFAFDLSFIITWSENGIVEKSILLWLLYCEGQSPGWTWQTSRELWIYHKILQKDLTLTTFGHMFVIGIDGIPFICVFVCLYVCVRCLPKWPTELFAHEISIYFRCSQ